MPVKHIVHIIKKKKKNTEKNHHLRQSYISTLAVIYPNIRMKRKENATNLPILPIRLYLVEILFCVYTTQVTREHRQICSISFAQIFS